MFVVYIPICLLGIHTLYFIGIMSQLHSMSIWDVWWWGGVLGAAVGEGVNTQLPGDRRSCQIISGRAIS